MRFFHPPMAGVFSLFLPFLVLPFLASSVAGQLNSDSGTSAESALRVFLDCQGGGVPCNQNHFRTEIAWVNWMRDRADADVHVMLTGEGVGGGGRRFTFDFAGQNGMEHLNDVLTYTSAGTDVQLATLNGVTHGLRLGLARFAVEAGLGSGLMVTFDGSHFSDSESDRLGSSSGLEEAGTSYDPWNSWTFRGGLAGNLSAQELRSSHRFSPSFSADRVTESWKLNFSVNANFNRDRIEFPDGRVVRNDREGWGVNTLIVRSINSHMSTGIDFGGGSSTQNNRRARFTVTPAIEWNYYPYAQSTRQQFIVHYGIGMQYNDYEEETVYRVMQETVPLHKLGIQYRAVQPWGNASISVDASQYLHGRGLYSYGASGSLSFRVVRGLELSLSASGSQIQDQIHVRLATLSDEDILLGRQSLPTSYRYQASIGFDYRWGSSFTNIVNTRFPASVR